MTTTLPRVLLGAGAEPLSDIGAHRDCYGPLPDLHRLAPSAIVELVDRAGLRGHGGAAFPVARKLAAVASRRGAKIVLGNGTEGEPASEKDSTLLRQVPQLVLDGAAVAARAVGAREVIIALPEDDLLAIDAVEAAVTSRRSERRRGEASFAVVGVPDRFISGQESALVDLLSGGEGRPTGGAPPFERGIRRAPTLVQNVETLAHLALIARHGADWFRQLGTPEDPGTALVTVSGAVIEPGVYEIEHGMALSELLRTAGVAEDLQAVLIGGYFGTWLPAAELPWLRLAPRLLAESGASLGAGVIVALGRSACPVAETARLADYFAAQSAGQCGPCVHGLAAIADTVQRVSTGTSDARAGHDLERWAGELPGRGACRYPDGAARFIASALQVFSAAFGDHARNGRCDRCAARPTLPTPMAIAGYSTGR
ncbi:MAG TPA: NADH-ubiquinone oxidoreductase-F iron-sulfur binding region domain-containing protein [Solirubrobacteraceae bacterium]|jgi:NADH:ubiquinone oxidoreductase subunit F (NADH-binding)|nr:NADH-ubiquinone oxidoreductase-F iron-sulfur binding region domain-containing protein [Solirubrobacteraceae bacterium]